MTMLAASEERAPTVWIGVVQPNTPLAMGHAEEKLRRLRAESARLQQEGAELIVWPEAGAYPYLVARPFVVDRPGRLRVLAQHSTPTIFGVATRDPARPYEYNSAAVLDGDGRVLGIYDKNILVPFGERIPIVDPDWAREQIPAMSHNLAGEGPGRFVVPLASGRSIVVGPLICYEDIFAGFARRVARQEGGVDVFVNLTIDTWFGDTAEPWEHLALAQFRSVEHRIPMVRAVAAGTSSYVDAQGRVRAALPVTDPRPGNVPASDRLLVEVPLARNTATEPTVYARWGWLFTPLSAMVVLVLLLVRRVRGAP